LPVHRSKYCGPECEKRGKGRARVRRSFVRFKADTQRATELIRQMEVVDYVPGEV